MYDIEIGTAYDTMRQMMIYGCELDGEYEFPLVKRIDALPGDVIDFDSSFERRVRDDKNLAVHFYIHDYKFERIWNNPDKYLPHLKKFGYVIMPNFTMCTCYDKRFPKVMNLWNKYRNHALAYYFDLFDIKVIPSVSIMDDPCYEFMLDGYMGGGTFACSTNGRSHNKESRDLFRRSFKFVCDELKPDRVLIIGKEIEGLETDAEIVYYKSRGQQMREERGWN